MFPAADPPWYRVGDDASIQPGELIFPVNSRVHWRIGLWVVLESGRFPCRHASDEEQCAGVLDQELWPGKEGPIEKEMEEQEEAENTCFEGIQAS